MGVDCCGGSEICEHAANATPILGFAMYLWTLLFRFARSRTLRMFAQAVVEALEYVLNSHTIRSDAKPLSVTVDGKVTCFKTDT